MKKIGICIVCAALVFSLAGCTAKKEVTAVPKLIEPVSDASDSAFGDKAGYMQYKAACRAGCALYRRDRI